MHTIEIDEAVFTYLKSQAEPFVDRTPNDVLRRLFKLADHSADRAAQHRRRRRRGRRTSNNSQAFVDQILEREFGVDFQPRSPYRTMFEGARHIVYFQNFDKAGTSNLWYRVKASALGSLRTSTKRAFIIFTNPAERLAYVIPVPDIDGRVARVGWKREDLEVNIDPASDRWRELDWDVSEYLRRY